MLFKNLHSFHYFCRWFILTVLEILNQESDCKVPDTQVKSMVLKLGEIQVITEGSLRNKGPPPVRSTQPSV